MLSKLVESCVEGLLVLAQLQESISLLLSDDIKNVVMFLETSDSLILKQNARSLLRLDFRVKKKLVQ